MGCFFGCFRVKDDRSRPHLVSSPSKSTERAVSRNRLSSLFLEEEKGEYPSNEQINKGLKNEAKFLKACGTIPETPAEIRKASQKVKHSPPCSGYSETSKFHSWLPNTSVDKFQLDEKSDQLPTPVKLFEALERRSESPENTPASCISNAANVSVDETVKTDMVSTSAHGRNKSVRFECEYDASSSKIENESQNPKLSPNPTPLKLSDEMQTPGTVFPSNLESSADGKTRIRSQYVQSVLNPVENASLSNVMKEGQPSSKEMLDKLKESPERPENASPEKEMDVKPTSSVKDSEEEGSLSSWLKPKHYTIDDHIRNIQANYSKIPQFRKTPGDRPIIGMVAAHWNDDEPSRISPKWWDGNGIPNSTNKYKEDQKVSWHATPFEERLEKALSDESLISQRKQVNQTQISFDETDESDTAISQLRPSPHSKSVVSF